MKIDGAIFDVDGVLLDTMPVWHDSAVRYLEHKGIEAEEGLGDKLFATTVTIGAEYLKKTYGLPESENEIRQGINDDMRLLGSTETILPYARIYGSFILIAAPAFVASYVLNNILRFEGRAAIAMTGMLTGAILNIGLDPLLIFVLDMGIAGAGISTAVSQYISFFILLSIFLRGKTQSKISVKSISRNKADYYNILATGFPSLLRQGLNSVSSMLLNQQAAVYGDPAVAAMSIVSRCCMMIICVCIGIGQGFQPVSGFNYGAGKYGRVRSAYFKTLSMTLISVGSLSLLALLFSNGLISHFSTDAEVLSVGTFALRMQLIALFFTPVSMCSNMLFQSTGNAKLATVTAALRSGICFIPLILILPMFFAITGVQIAQPIADIMACRPHRTI